MKIATEVLKNEQIKIYQRHWKQALLYRNVWNIDANKYEWESEPLDLERYLYKINPVKWKLDTERLNLWKVSNVTLEVYNYINEWSPDNPYGIFQDKFARGSKIVIKAGNYLADESKELLYVFTGVIDKDLEFEPDKKICRIPLTSLDFLLQRTNAENVSQPGSNLRSGDGSTKVFDTNPTTGIGRFTRVVVESIDQEPGKDFTVSDLNNPNAYGKVTFAQAPPFGTNNIELYFIYWYQDQTIEWLVEELIKEADITDYQVDPAIFDNFILGQWEQTTTADFNAGTPFLVNTDNDRVVLASDNKSLFGGTTTETYAIVINPENIRDDDEDTYAAIGSTAWVAVVFASLEGIFEIEVVHSSPDGAGVPFFVDAFYDSSWHNIGSYETGSGKETLEIFYPKSEVKKIRVRRPSDPLRAFFCYELRAIGYYNSGNLLSQTKDLTIDLVSYGKLEYTYIAPSETTLVIKTQSSANNIDWEAEKDLGVNQQVLSTPQRYFRWKAYFDNSATWKTPTLYDVTLNYYLSNLKIQLANFTGLNCYSAIKQLASFVDYEIGFNAEGKFFFRSKETINPPVLTLKDSEDKLTKLYNLTKGWDWVYNWIEANYGSYTKIIDPISRNEARPHSIDKYGFRRLTLSGGQLLIDEEVDIATGIALRYYGKFENGSLVYYRYPVPKKMCNAQIKFLPQLDLSDVVTVTYYSQVDGDKFVFKFNAWTFNDFKFAPEPLVKDLDFKIIGIDLDLEKWNVKLDLRQLDT